MTARLAALRGQAAPQHDAAAARRAWSNGWGITIGQHYPCPTRWLTRRRCPGEGCCWWTGGTQVRALDHVYGITRQRDSRRELLAMPYGLTDHDAAALTAWCGERRLTWTVLGDGWHFPGTVAVVIFPEGA